MPPDSETKNSRAWFKDPDADPARSTRKYESGLFGWTVLILIFIAIAIACWIGSFYIFGHPEKPLSHQVLTRLKKIESPKRFELTAAPRGEFLRAPQIIERYSKMKTRQLARANETLLRNYIRNYKPAEGLVPYVIGTFNILDSFELTGGDFFPSGVVAIAQSKENPNLLIEQIFSADARVIPTLHRTLLTGLDIDLKRENELAAIINVERLSDGRIKLTTVSILYPSYESASTDGTFTLDPPESLNVRAGLPVVDAARQSEADGKYDHFRRKARLAGKSVEPLKEEAPPAPSRLMRVERPLAANEADPIPPPPAPVSNPLVASAAPVPQSIEVRVAIPIVPTPAPTPAMDPQALPSPSPAESPSPSPSATPEPPKAIAAATSRNWQVYEPGRMPRGRLISPSDLAEIAKKGTGGERVYLQGNFNVTAAGGDRAVLRAPQRGLGFGSRGDNIRIIVQYPNGMMAPSDGSSVARDARRPFQVMDVRESTAGQINVYVREVTKP
jgi:hypothetical protein